MGGEKQVRSKQNPECATQQRMLHGEKSIRKEERGVQGGEEVETLIWVVKKGATEKATCKQSPEIHEQRPGQTPTSQAAADFLPPPS